jgi:hypothetical protein
MPGVVVPLHELLERVKDVPDVDDCYLVGIWSDVIPEGDAEAVEHGVFPPTPLRADKFDALTSAREGDEDGWEYQWGWDGEPGDGDRVRVGCNTPTVRHPIYLRFRWGEGVPGVVVDGIEMLPHVEAVVEASYKDRFGKPVLHRLELCDYCDAQITGTVSDCPGRRLHALAEAVAEGHRSAAEMHAQAVDMWHLITRSERYKSRF